VIISTAAPAGVDISRRIAGNREVYITVNSTSEAKVVELSRPMKLSFAQAEASRIELPAYGVEILTSPQH